MKEKLRFVGLDVHAETIAVAVAEPEGEVRSLGTIPNRAESIRKLIKKLGPADKLRACYEAGPTGYVVYWQLAELGVECEVVAPTLIPVKAGDRVKTDRRDAEKLARCYRSGDLTAVWVPDEGSDALCDRLDRTRDNSQRQLPTDHDYAVPTREYQTDQSSPFLPWLLNEMYTGPPRQPPQQPHRSCWLTQSLHIRPMHSSRAQNTVVRFH